MDDGCRIAVIELHSTARSLVSCICDVLSDLAVGENFVFCLRVIDEAQVLQVSGGIFMAINSVWHQKSIGCVWCLQSFI
jgi:hypothetical protein